MEIFVTVLLIICGLVLIIYGGNLLVNNAVKISKLTGIPEAIIGATIVALATTLPELSVTVFSSMDNLNDMAIGNAIGSMLFNITFIIGICITFSPEYCNKKTIKKNFYILFLSIVFILIFGLTKGITKFEGWILIIVFIAYFVFNIFDVVKKVKIENFNMPIVKVVEKFDKKKLLAVAVAFIIGSFLVFFGGKLLVTNGSIMAKLLNLSDHIIGVTVVAIGTSLPEVVTSISSIKHKCTSLAIGNTIGANILSSTLLVGTTAIISKETLFFDGNITNFALPLLLFAMLVIYIPISKHNKTNKRQGIVLLLLSIIYYITLIF